MARRRPAARAPGAISPPDAPGVDERTWRGHDALQAILRPLGDLTPDPKNARKHGDRSVAALKDSLLGFGQRKPIVAQRVDGKLVVRAGNGTLEAARALGWTHLAVLAFDDDDRTAQAFALADNRTAELSEWDEEILGDLLRDLEGAGGVPAVGFSPDEIRELTGPAAPQADPDEIPEPPAVPTSRRGDLFILGEHRLLCGDSTNAEDVARLLDGAAPRLLLTDPPYGVEYDASWRDRAGLNACGPAEPTYMDRGKTRQNVTISGDTKADWSDAFELVPSLDTAYVWHASAFAIEVGTGLRRIGFEIKQQIIWRKPHFTLSRQHYHWQHEPCWYARKEKCLKFLGSRDQATIWDAASPKMLMNPGGANEAREDHPTQKPVVLYTRPIENHLRAGELFYEPFGGSGTGIAAAQTTDRRCFSMEIDPRFIDVIVARWERVSGRKAERRRA